MGKTLACTQLWRGLCAPCSLRDICSRKLLGFLILPGGLVLLKTAGQMPSGNTGRWCTLQPVRLPEALGCRHLHTALHSQMP